MSYKADPIHEAADKAAELTGVPKLIRKAEANQHRYRPRRQIVLPAIALAGSIMAFVSALYGVLVIVELAPIFFVVAYLTQFFGPIRLRSVTMPYDEYEQLLIWRSRSIGMGAAFGLAVIGLAGFNGFAMLTELDNFDANVPLHMLITIGFPAMWLLVTTAMTVTTISASLLLPDDVTDEEE